METNKNKLFSDFIWYFLGSIIPAFFSFFKLSVFTRHFTPEEYGIYTLITTTFAYLTMGLYTWISSCIWRFYYEAKVKNELKKFFSHIFILYSTSSIILITITLIWANFSATSITRKLVLFSMLQLVSGQLLQFILITLRIEGRALLYNIINATQVAVAFGLLFVFVFYFHRGIESFLTSQCVVNFILLLFLLFKTKVKLFHFQFSQFSKSYLRELIHYGFVGFITNLGLMIISMADRYIIAMFETLKEVGIYNQVYLIGQFAVFQVIQVFFNTINPSMIKLLTHKNSSAHIYQYIVFFGYLFLPLTAFLSLFSKQLSEILLGAPFRSGYIMLPFIMFGALFYGYSLFSELVLKFEKKYKALFICIITACCVNIGLNLVLIPLLNYKIAAFVTFISYVTLAIMYSFYTHVTFIKQWLQQKKVFVIIIVLILFDFFIRYVFLWKINLYGTITEGIVFALIYLMAIKKSLFKMFNNIRYL